MKHILVLIYIVLLPLFTPAQTWLWAKTTGATPWAGTTKVITNTDGNIYCVGGFVDSMVLEDNTYYGWNGMQGGNGFLAKYDPNGLFLKIGRISKQNNQSGFSTMSLNHDISGNIYLTGNMDGSNIYILSVALIVV